MFEFNFRLFFLLEAYFSGRVRPVGRGTGRQTLLDSTSGCTDSEAVSHKKSGKDPILYTNPIVLSRTLLIILTQVALSRF